MKYLQSTWLVLSPRQVVNAGVCWILEMSVREPEAVRQEGEEYRLDDPWVLDLQLRWAERRESPGEA